MELIIETVKDGDFSMVSSIGNDKFAYEVYRTLKQQDMQLAIEFFEKYRYYKFTGRLMAA